MRNYKEKTLSLEKQRKFRRKLKFETKNNTSKKLN